MAFMKENAKMARQMGRECNAMPMVNITQVVLKII